MAYKDPNDERARIARRKHYHNNKEQYVERNKKKRAAMVAHLREIKDVPCMDCGIKYPYYVMDLDHRDPSEKTGNINQVLQDGSWKKFIAEIAKCDVVCSNCHRERTHACMV